MILLEYEIEKAIRKAIRDNLEEAGKVTASLLGAHIIGYWLDTEDGTDIGQDAAGVHVLIMAHPNSSDGYNSSYALEPQRSMQVDIICVSQPDSDNTRQIARELYRAVRSVFETVPSPLVMPDGVEFGACMMSSGGAADIDNLGQVSSFQVEMKISLL